MRVGKPDGHVTGQEQESLAAGFGARLRELREAAGMTRARLATLAGVAEMTVEFLETGHRRPGKTTLAAMGAILSPQNADAVAQELTELAGGSARPGWKRSTPPGRRGLTLEQARRALQLARDDRALARKVHGFRPSAAAEGHLKRADAAVKDAQLDLRRAESLAAIGPHVAHTAECPAGGGVTPMSAD
ncbi:multiprotein-bridging factor 1 family protein [Pseudarthrobacter sp. NPDC092439]|uniref:helix-turn-helix domain-containing protein n=1 Tax=unclassified Pseudarthrobacter TaxID=2647000 RepID=UPI00381A4FED